MYKCGGCGRFLSGGATCTKCKALYHRQCVNLPTSSATPKHWKCPCCVVNVPRKDNTDTPVKGPQEPLSPKIEDSPQLEDVPQVEESPKSENALQPEDSPQPKLTSKPHIVPEIISPNESLVLKEIRALREDMNIFHKDLGSFRDEVRVEMKDLRGMYKKSDARISELTDRLNSQEFRLADLEDICKASQREKNELKTEVELLKQDIERREQQDLANDIEIAGITEHSGENPMHLTMSLMTIIGAKDIDERDIVEARRVGPVRVGVDGRPIARPLVVRVTRRAVREQVLRCARTRRNVKTADIGVAGTPRSVYINERLTRKNRLLFGQTRTQCKQHKWSFTWTREGQIYIRQASGKPSFRIRSDADLKKHFQN